MLREARGFVTEESGIGIYNKDRVIEDYWNPSTLKSVRAFHNNVFPSSDNDKDFGASLSLNNLDRTSARIRITAIGVWSDDRVIGIG